MKARIKLLTDIQTDTATLKAGQIVLCNWPDATRMEIAGLAKIQWENEREHVGPFSLNLNHYRVLGEQPKERG